MSHSKKHLLSDVTEHDLTNLETGVVQIEENGGVKSLVSAPIPTASAQVPGLIKVGDGLDMTQDGHLVGHGFCVVARHKPGEIFYSLLPITDNGAHLLDGSLLTHSEYGEFVDYVAAMQTEHPTLFTDETSWQNSVTAYGVCGKFVYDSTNQTLRIPKATGIVEGTIVATAVGDLVLAGLPNIDGEFWSRPVSGEQDTSGAFGREDASDSSSNSSPVEIGPQVGSAPSTTLGARVTFSAQRSNAIYGNSSTVQPQTIKGYVYIAVNVRAYDPEELPVDELGVAMVKVNCSGLSAGAEVTLTKGLVQKTEQVADGSVTFRGVSYGVWTLAGGSFSRQVEVSVAKVYEISLATVYAYRCRVDDSNPMTRVAYPKTITANGVQYPVENYGYEPIRNLGGAGVSYGSWTGGEFFFPKPCMVTYAGVLDYYLDPNDYAKAIDGTASDVANASYGGNAMVQFPKAWVRRKQVEDGGVTYEEFVLSDAQLDGDFHAYAHKDSVDGTLRDSMYQAAYAACTVSGRIRSLSGQTITVSLQCAASNANLYSTSQADSMMKRAIDNNTAGNLSVGRWFCRTWAQWVYLQDLTFLLTRCTDAQSAIGKGNCGNGSGDAAVATTGGTNLYGLFGGDTSGVRTQVKCLGIEDLWANHWKWAIGRSLVSNKNTIKMCVDGEDGSTAGVYNFAGTGGVNTGQGQLPTNGWNYPTAYAYAQFGRYGTAASGGSSSVYCCDGEYYSSSVSASTALVGGRYANGLNDGPVCVNLNNPLSNSNANIGFALSRPLQTVQAVEFREKEWG